MIKLVGIAMLTLLMAGCASLPDVSEGSTLELRVLTYNIHHGEGTDGRLDLERIARIIKSSGADLVALQEVDQQTMRTGGIDQAAELGRLTGMKHVFGAAMDFQGGRYGQAVLSKWPIERHAVHQLPQRAGREPRIALTTFVQAPGRKLTFVSTHLDHQLEEVRVQQAEMLNSLVSKDEDVILVGDFNAVPKSKTMATLASGWLDAAGPTAAPTIPAEKPTRRIDYILLSPIDRWEVVSAQVLEEPVASDHRPVFAVLRLAEEPKVRR